MDLARSRGRRAMRVTAGLVLLLLAGLTGVVLAMDARLERVDVDGLGAGPDVATIEPVDDGRDAPPLTVLVLGSDSREVLTPEERRELGTGDADGERTETIALFRLDPSADQPRLLNVPRDALVTRCDGTRGRVNAAYGIGERQQVGGGLSCVVRTLRDWLGIRIDHVVKVDFRGFVDIVDAIGGVHLWFREPLQDERAKLDVPAGCVRLDGAQSLAFVRARKIDDDFGRMARQQRFIEELRREITALGILDDLPRLLRTADAVAQAVQLDSSLTLNRLQQLARQYRSAVDGPIDARAIPGAIQTEGPAFLHVDEGRAQELVTWLLEGDDPAEQARRSDDTEGTTVDEGGGGHGPADPSGDAPPHLDAPASGQLAGERHASEVPVVDRCR